MTLLDGKVALVTRASGAIGRAIAVKLASRGAAIAARYGSNVAAVTETARLVDAAGSNVEIFKADMADAAQIRAMFAVIDGAYGRLDILINNAGVGIQRNICDISEEDFEKTFAINTKGYLFCMQEAGKRIGEGGRIINISSVLAQLSRPGPVEPGMFQDTSETIRERARALSPFNRVGAPEDIADIVAFLA
ncbi:MAG: SDR family oxidoreductase [Woeseia sp.]